MTARALLSVTLFFAGMALGAGLMQRSYEAAGPCTTSQPHPATGKGFASVSWWR